MFVICNSHERLKKTSYDNNLIFCGGGGGEGDAAYRTISYRRKKCGFSFIFWTFSLKSSSHVTISTILVQCFRHFCIVAHPLLPQTKTRVKTANSLRRNVLVDQ